MDPNNLERLIELGRNEMYQNKNYEEAEKIFTLAKERAPDFRTTYISMLLDICRERKCTENKEHRHDSKEAKTELKNYNTGGASVDYGLRGGREAMKNKTSTYEYFPQNMDPNNIEQLIEFGKNEMYRNKNYEEAEKIFNYVIKNAPDFRTYPSLLLDICAKKKEHLHDSKKAKTEQTSDNTGCTFIDYSVRGGREAMKNKISWYENIPMNVCLESTAKAGTVGFGTKDDKSLLNYAQTQNRDTYSQENVKTVEKYPEYERKGSNELRSCYETREIKQIKESEERDTINSAKNEQYDLDKGLGRLPKEDNTTYIDNDKAPKYGEELQNIDVNPLEEECNILTSNASALPYPDVKVNIQEEREAEMLKNSLVMRSFVLQIGIKAFALKPNYRPDVDFEYVSLQIDDLILRARSAYLLRNERYKNYISEAERKYSEVAIILPQASINKHTGMNKPKAANTDTKNSEKTSENVTITAENINIKSVSYKEFVKGDNIDVMKCLKLAETALIAEDFKKAERLIKKSERICPTKNAQELLKKLEVARKETIEREDAKQAAELAAKYAAEEAEKKANELAAKKVKELAAKRDEELAAKKAKELAAKREKELAAKKAERLAAEKDAAKKEFEIKVSKMDNIKKGSRTTQTEIVDNIQGREEKIDANKAKAEQCLDHAKKAFHMNHFIDAEFYLSEAKQLHPKIDIDCLQNKVRITIASRSSTNADFLLVTEDDESSVQLTGDKKRNSKQYLKIAKQCLDEGNFTQAEMHLLEAEKHYNSMDVKKMFKVIEEIKKSGKDSIPEPSYVDSCSENHFALHPGEKEAPSHHLGNSNLEEDRTEEYLKTSRLALTLKMFDKAEELADKCLKTAPVRAQGLLADIDESRKVTSETMTLRSGRKINTNNDHDTGCAAQKEWITPGQHKYSEINLDEANEYLHRSESLQSTAKGQQMFEHTVSERSKTHTECKQHSPHSQPSTYSEMVCRSGKNIESNKEAYNDCIEKAEEALLKNDYSTAERLVKRAHRMQPNDKLEAFIEKIQDEKKKSEELKSCHNVNKQIARPLLANDNQLEAKRCEILAEEAYAQGDLDKAERLFVKASRMDSSKTIQESLIKLRHEKQMKNMEMGQNKDTESTLRPSDENISTAQKFNSWALDAIKLKSYYVAEHYLEKGNHIYPNDTTQVLLKDVRVKIEESLGNTQHEQQIKYIAAEKHKQMKTEAEKYLKMAEEKLQQNDIDNAQSFAILSDSFCSSGGARKILKRIFDLKYKTETNVKNKNFKEEKNCCISERYIEVAAIAFKHGDFYLAEEYLIQSKKIYHNPKAEEMLAKVRAAIKHVVDGQDFSSSNRLKVLYNWAKEKFF